MQTVEHLHIHDDHQDDNNFQAWLKVAVLAGLALYFTYIIASGNLTNYINARFAWLAYLAAGLFYILSGAGGYSLLKRASHDHDHEHDHHNHQPISWSVLFIMAIPLILGTLIPSQPLGADAVDGISLHSVASTDATAFSIDPLERNILDWLRVFSRNEDLSMFDGELVDVTGFVYREPTFPAGHFMVARFTISCCVADSSAIGLPVAFGDSASVEEGKWVRVQGDFQVGQFRNEITPIVQASAVEFIEQPEHPYLYP